MPDLIEVLESALAKAGQIEKLRARLASILRQVSSASKSNDVRGVVAATLSRTKLKFSKSDRAAKATPAKKKGKLSAAGRAAIAAAQKKRWAKVKAAKGRQSKK